MLEEPGVWGDCHRDIIMDVVLASQDLPALGFKVHYALLTDSLSAADRVQDYTGLACCLEECGTCVNGNLPTVGLEGYIEVFHVSHCVNV